MKTQNREISHVKEWQKNILKQDACITGVTQAKTKKLKCVVFYNISFHQHTGSFFIYERCLLGGKKRREKKKNQ